MATTQEILELILKADDTALKRAQQTVIATTQDFYDLADSYELIGEAEEKEAARLAEITAIQKAHNAQIEERRARTAAAKQTIEEYLATQIKVAGAEQATSTALRGVGVAALGSQQSVQQIGYMLGDLGQTSGDLGMKLNSVTNNIQFMLSPLGTWGVAIGVAATAAVSLYRNWDLIVRAFQEKNPFPETARTAHDAEKALEANSKALEKLKGFASLTNTELIEFNKLTKESIQLTEQHAALQALEAAKKTKGFDEKEVAAQVKKIQDEVGGKQFFADVLTAFKAANAGGFGDASDKALVDNLVANAMSGRADAASYLNDLLFSATGSKTKSGSSFIAGGGAPNLAGAAAIQDAQQRQMGADEAGRKERDAIADLQKQFGQDMFKQFQDFAAKHQLAAFQPGEEESSAFKRFAETQRAREAEGREAAAQEITDRMAEQARKTTTAREEQAAQERQSNEAFQRQTAQNPAMQRMMAADQARAAALEQAQKSGLIGQVAAVRAAAANQGVSGRALAEGTEQAARSALAQSGLYEGLTRQMAERLTSNVVNRVLQDSEQRLGAQNLQGPGRLKAAPPPDNLPRTQIPADAVEHNRKADLSRKVDAASDAQDAAAEARQAAARAQIELFNAQKKLADNERQITRILQMYGKAAADMAQQAQANGVSLDDTEKNLRATLANGRRQGR